MRLTAGVSLPLSDDLEVVPAVISFICFPLITEHLCFLKQWLTIPLMVGSILLHNGHLNSDVAVVNIGVGADNALLWSFLFSVGCCSWLGDITR